MAIRTQVLVQVVEMATDYNLTYLVSHLSHIFPNHKPLPKTSEIIDQILPTLYNSCDQLATLMIHDLQLLSRAYDLPRAVFKQSQLKWFMCPTKLPPLLQKFQAHASYITWRTHHADTFQNIASTNSPPHITTSILKGLTQALQDAITTESLS